MSGKSRAVTRGAARPSPTSGPNTPRSATRRTDQRALERAAPQQGGQRSLLRLYITGTTPASSRAVEGVRRICDEHLQGRYQLEVIDIHRKPALVKDEQIIATPTLVKVLPAPLRRFIGDLSKVDRVLFGLDLRRTP